MASDADRSPQGFSSLVRAVVRWSATFSIAGGLATALILAVPNETARTVGMVALGCALLGATLAYAYWLTTQGTAERRTHPLKTNTTDALGFCLFGAFLATLLMAYFPAVSGNGKDAWAELFKSGTVLLGGTLTTVVGYYFGTRNAEKQADQAAVAAVRQDRKAVAQEAEAAPTLGEDALGMDVEEP